MRYSDAPVAYMHSGKPQEGAACADADDSDCSIDRGLRTWAPANSARPNKPSTYCACSSVRLITCKHVCISGSKTFLKKAKVKSCFTSHTSGTCTLHI